MELVESNSGAPVIVLAASALRSAPLDHVADALRDRGATVEVVAGVDRRRVDLLKLSFRYRADASYLLFGGPELREDTLRSITVELEANGVPSGRISGAMMEWDAAGSLTRQAIDRLAAMGVDIDDAGPALPRPTLISAAPASPPPPPEDRTGDLQPPIPSSGRALGAPRAAWAVGGLIAMAAVVGIGVAISSGDAAADSTDVPTEVRLAAVGESAADAPAARTPSNPDAAPTPAVVADPAIDPSEDADLPLEVLDEAPDVLPEADAIEPPTLTGDDAALVYAALRSQSIRALDILLVSPPASRKRGRRTVAAKMNFESAREHCENLDVEGVTRWRLPDIGEVQWLSKSNLIRNGIYWTSTKADAFGGERVIWNPRSKRMRSSSLRWRGGRVVCVRYQNGDDPGPR